MTYSNVSFLMPVRNGGRFITSSINSTLKTMHSKDRLLVVIDSSTDDSEDIARKQAREDPRISVVVNPGEHGVANALNYGLALVETDFVARIDADDVCLPWRRSFAISQMLSKNLDFFFTTAVIFGDGVRFPAPQPFVSIKIHEAGWALAVNNPMVHSTMMARTLAIRQLGGYVPGPAEDYDLWARASLAGYRIFRHAIPTVLFRVHNEQLTRSKEWTTSLQTPPSVLELRKRLGEPQRNPDIQSTLSNRLRSWYFR